MRSRHPDILTIARPLEAGTGCATPIWGEFSHGAGRVSVMGSHSGSVMNKDDRSANMALTFYFTTGVAVCDVSASHSSITFVVNGSVLILSLSKSPAATLSTIAAARLIRLSA